jgi:SAM-dependent methyltransferase
MRGTEPTLDDVREFWRSHVNNEYYTDATRASDRYFAEIEARRYQTHYHLRDLFDSLADSHGALLEIGCGIGLDSVQLALCGFDVTGIDLTEGALEVAAELARRREVMVDFRLGNAEALDEADRSFDAVYSFGVLHHTPNIEAAVREVHRVLRPGGTVYVMLYHRWSLVNLVHSALRLPYESPRHRRDHCPVVSTFGRRAARQLFGSFSTVEVHSAYPFTYGFGPLCTRLPLPIRRLLGRVMGWHLMITAIR